MMRAISSQVNGKKRGFTLVELVIVVLVIGILTAVAAPKMMNTANSARLNGTKHSLFVLRDALENYKATTGAYPTAAQLTSTAANTGFLTYLSGTIFPTQQITTANVVSTVAAGTSPITAPTATPGGWIYDPASGEIRINDTSAITY